MQEQAGLLAAGYEPELAAEVGRPGLEAAASILRKMPPHDFVHKQVRQRAGYNVAQCHSNGHGCQELARTKNWRWFLQMVLREPSWVCRCPCHRL
jgi:hypothetical protein